MKRSKVLWALAGLNAMLVVVLMWRLGGENPARAQAAQARSDYLMVPARVSGANNGVVYMIDTRNGLLSAFFYDNNRKELNVMDPINLGRIFENGGGVGGGNRQQPRKP
jgi:hypothetical protein